MTIAACYVSPEGIVLGADSTATFTFGGGGHYYNHNQKLFELGDNDTTFGIVTWGLGGLGPKSYRTLFAQLSDEIRNNAPPSVRDVADRWAAMFWAEYSACPDLQAPLQHARQLNAKRPHNPADPGAADTRTQDEEVELANLVDNLTVGFCVGGYVRANRIPEAYEVVASPILIAPPIPSAIPMHNHRFWGAPILTDRLIHGCDNNFIQRLVASGKWQGTPQELQAVIAPGRLHQPIMPIRDAIDFVHTCIYSTIKGLKFSTFGQICGGPIELAVITTDRKFRWVRHKEWDAAVSENG